jgi:4-amino-4-deoxy-L-arabinose transferase-like glycosyltransferase
MKDNKLLKPILYLFICSILLRLIYFFVFKIDVLLSGDEGEYLAIAEKYFLTNISDIKNYLIRRAPLAGIVLSPFLQIFGNDVNVARLVNVLISSLLPPLLFFVAKDHFNYSRKESLIISFIFAFYPPAIFYSSMIQSESLAALLMLACFYQIKKLQKWYRYKNVIILGIFFGLLSMTRSSNYYLLLFILPIIFFIEEQKTKKVLKKLLLVLIFFFLTLSPLIIHNYNMFGQYIPTEPRLGYALYICNNDLDNDIIKKGGYYKDSYIMESWKKIKTPMQLIQWDNELKNKAITEIKEDYLSLIIPVINRFINFWTFRPNPYKEDFTFNDYIMFVLWMPILLLYSLSFYFVKDKNYVIVDIIIGYTCLVALPFWGIPRFRFIVDALIIIKSFDCAKKLYSFYPKIMLSRNNII